MYRQLRRELVMVWSLTPNLWGHPLVDLLPGRGVGHILVCRPAHIELVHLSEKLLGNRGVSGRWVIRHAMKPAMPE